MTERIVAYFDRAARSSDERLNYSDLVLYEDGYQDVDRGDLLVPVCASAAGGWALEAPLVVTHVEVGGDSLDIYMVPSVLPARGEVSRAELAALGFAFEPRAWPRRVPGLVARHLGLG